MTTAPMNVLGLDHLVLRVEDLGRSLAFYCDVLGMRLERVISDTVHQLRCGRNLIDLMPRRADPGPEYGIDHFCVNVQGDMAAIVDHLEANDVTITLGPVEMYGATGFGTSVYVKDPDGYVVELKTDHAEFPVRTTMEDVLATLSRPAVERP